MKLHHVVLYRFKPGCDRIEEHLAVIDRFRGATEGLLDLVCGRNVLPAYSGRYSHGFIMTFASPEALAAYNRSEAHRFLVQTFKPDIEDKMIVDFQTP